MRTRTITWVGAGAIAGSLALLSWSVVPAAGATVGTHSTPAAGAVTPTGSVNAPSTPAGRQHLEYELSRRQDVLSRLTSSVGDDRALATSVRQTLDGQLAAEISGIDALVSTVPNEPAGTLAKSASTMVHQYRVYLVMVPKVRIAERAARQMRSEQRASSLEAKVSARIDSAQSQGRTVQQAQAAFRSLVTAVSQATSDTASVDVAAVLGVEPANYPGDGGAITTARADLRMAASVLPAVRVDLGTIRSSLR